MSLPYCSFFIAVTLFLVNGINSKYIITDPNKRYEHLSTINYECITGFAISKMTSATTAVLLKCIDGQWDSPPLTCYAKCRSWQCSSSQFLTLSLQCLT